MNRSEGETPFLNPRPRRTRAGACRCLKTKGTAPRPNSDPGDSPSAGHKLDDEDYPAYSMGRAAEILGVTQALLRALDTARLLVPRQATLGR